MGKYVKGFFMPYAFYALIPVVIFSLVHLWAEKVRSFEEQTGGRFLSAAGGIAIAYVFVDLLPKLGKSDQIVREALAGMFPLIEKHVYVMALIGFLFYFAVDRGQFLLKERGRYWLSILSYALFNFLIGYAVVDKDDPEVRPLVLFTFAITLHYFMIDYSLGKEGTYGHKEKWALVAALFLGWGAGLGKAIPPTAIALVSAFIGGGMIMNVTRHELPKQSSNSLNAFILSAFFYTVVLLFLGYTSI